MTVLINLLFWRDGTQFVHRISHFIEISVSSTTVKKINFPIMMESLTHINGGYVVGKTRILVIKTWQRHWETKSHHLHWCWPFGRLFAKTISAHRIAAITGCGQWFHCKARVDGNENYTQNLNFWGVGLQRFSYSVNVNPLVTLFLHLSIAQNHFRICTFFVSLCRMPNVYFCFYVIFQFAVLTCTFC